MNLVQALRLTVPTRLALVGAGGKTTALFQISRQLQPPVIITATTHLAISQVNEADRWIIATVRDDVAHVLEQIEGQVVLFTGPDDGSGRLAGVEGHVLAQILSMADRLACPLIIEADGSRQLPLKAPAPHEPVIPAFCNQVIVVAGLSALGKPLTSDWVHRVERYCDVSGLMPGDVITTDAIAKALLHPLGGMKDIPSGARRLALLNQADMQELQSQAGLLGQQLLEGYDSVMIASLNPTGYTGESGETQRESGKVHAVYEPIAGIILAAGGAQRFGEPKLLLTWKGEAIIRHVAKTALQAGLDPVIVVSGEQVDEISRILDDLNVLLVHNPDWQSGQSTSLQAGMSALADNTGGVLFILGDQPQIPASLARALMESHAASLAPIVAPMVDGQRGNPVLFDRETFPELMALRGDTGGRPLFARYPVEWVPWHDSSVLFDIDTPDDYWNLQNMPS